VPRLTTESSLDRALIERSLIDRFEEINVTDAVELEEPPDEIAKANLPEGCRLVVCSIAKNSRARNGELVWFAAIKDVPGFSLTGEANSLRALPSIESRLA
jgi:hypothetical protein